MVSEKEGKLGVYDHGKEVQPLYNDAPQPWITQLLGSGVPYGTSPREPQAWLPWVGGGLGCSFDGGAPQPWKSPWPDHGVSYKLDSSSGMAISLEERTRDF